jgi:hypothetical protein
MEKLFQEIKNVVIAGKHKEIEALVQKAIQDKTNLWWVIALRKAKYLSRKCLSLP